MGCLLSLMEILLTVARKKGILGRMLVNSNRTVVRYSETGGSSNKVSKGSYLYTEVA